MRSPTDKELWQNSCITREQLRTWTDNDLATHSAGIRKTLLYLFELIDRAPTIDSHGTVAAAFPR